MYSNTSPDHDELDNIAQRYYQQQLSAYLGRKNAQAAAEQMDMEDIKISKVSFSTELPIVHIYEQEIGYCDNSGYLSLESTELEVPSDSLEDPFFRCLRERILLAQAEYMSKSNWVENEYEVVAESSPPGDYYSCLLIPRGKLPIKERSKSGANRQIAKVLKRESKRRAQMERIKEVEKQANKKGPNADAKKPLEKNVKQVNEKQPVTKESNKEKPVQKSLFGFLNLRFFGH
ncbi:hypothetical protein CLU79DRAFT_836354 [Phycomyces nitens]|nr:hypothetical protein CLU79DRAFT_836354 [Phycomyces nitens]